MKKRIIMLSVGLLVLPIILFAWLNIVIFIQDAISSAIGKSVIDRSDELHPLDLRYSLLGQY